MKGIRIGNKMSRVPVIQGGMGVGISMHRLAGAVAAAGGVGIISTADIGYQEADFGRNPRAANIRAIHSEMKKAREISKDGIIGFNVMVALRDYEEIVKACVDAGADLIISGAGLPMNLPELVSGSGTRIAPIVSSGRALSVISRRWKKKYDYVPDMVVVEGPKAGGHLGFKPDQLSSPSSSLETVTADVLDITRTLEPPGEKIPVIAAGGVFDGADISRFLRLGADGVQMATRFVATEECDASLPYKMAYINADESDAVIISSPVGMPGRAIRNRFVERTTSVKQSISRCYNCIKTCHVTDAPYCITKALIDAVRGDVENGLVFCGSNVGRIREIVSVKALMERLEKEYSLAEQAAGCSLESPGRLSIHR